ncbi:MAG: flagellar basal body-associated FliL family protein [Oligoflexia bacterium]|nr:flagellar basal body-associated FliL family protein [Oligoflexia bacterium]
MAEEKVAADQAQPAAGGGGSNKIVLGILGLNTVVMVAVVAVLFLGQKKQASQQTLDQVAEGAAHSEPSGGGGDHGAPAASGGDHGAPAAGDHGSAGEAAHTADARFFSVGDFTANLSGPASTHYVKVSVNFEINKDADEEEFKQRKPQFRDKIISLLNAKKPTDLQSVDGRNFLKDEIKEIVNTIIQKGKVEGVYFSAFVIN